MNEKLHQLLLKPRNVYRAHVKRGRCKVLLERYNKMLGLNVTYEEYERTSRRTGCDEEEYFGFEFYKKTEAERDEYLTRVRRNEIARKVGDVVKPLTIPGNKVLFNMIFGEFLHREWINPTAATPEAFAQFVRKHGNVLVKPSTLCSGSGIYKYAYEGDEAAHALQKKLYGGGYVVEEILKQHPHMDQINPHTINSLRVATYTDADEVHLLAAALRFSMHAEGCIDNLHAGGCACAVNTRTGVITSDAFNNDFSRHSEHPLTGTHFKGFQLPMWDQVVETVRAASRRAYELPQCRFLGWDIAFTPDGVAVLEGNWMQGCDLIQYAQGGIYHQLNRLSDKL